MVYLVTGASGQLGSHVVAASLDNVVALSSGSREFQIHSTDSQCQVTHITMDFSKDPAEWQQAFRDLLEEHKIDHVLHCAAYTNVQRCFDNKVDAVAVNVTATKAIAEACRDSPTVRTFILTSTDMVFDGEKEHVRPPCHGDECLIDARGAYYTERDPTCPLSFYGKTKVDAENAVADVFRYANTTCLAIVLRLPLMFGVPHVKGSPSQNTSFATQLRQFAKAEPVHGFFDEWRSPINFGSAALVMIGMTKVIDADRVNPMCESVQSPTHAGTLQVFHVAGSVRISRIDLLRQIQQDFGNMLLNNLKAFPEISQLDRLLECFALDIQSTNIVSPVVKASAAVAFEASGNKEILSPEELGIRSYVAQLGQAILRKEIFSKSRNSQGASELRPKDLSMNAHKLHHFFKTAQMTVFTSSILDLLESETIEKFVIPALGHWVDML